MKKSPEEIIETLDLSGGTDSWFDFWHTPLDWEGEGNSNWHARGIYLTALLKLYTLVCERLKVHPNPFQVWIDIYEDDSSQDAIYIHTSNPNSENFPVTFDANKKPTYKNNNLKDFITRTKLSVVAQPTEIGTLFSLYDKNIGLPIS